MKSIAKKDYFSELIYILLAIFAVMIVLYFCEREQNNKINNYSNVINIINDGWTLENSRNDENTEITLTAKVKDASGEHIIISRDIDKEFTEENSIMCISSYYCDANVYINGEMIFNYQSYKEGIGRSDGVARLMVNLPEIEHDGKLTIEYIPQFKMNSYEIRSPVFGDKTDIIMHFYIKDLFDIFLAMASIFIGVIIIFIDIMSNEKIRKEIGLIYIGMYALFTGIYLTSQIEWVHMVFKYSKVLYVSECLSMSLLALPILLLIYKFTYSNYNKFFKGAIIITMINFMGQIIVYVSGKSELRNMIIYSHGVLLASCILICTTVFAELDGQELKKLGLKKSIIMLAFTGICEMVSFYFNLFAIGEFLKMGMLFFVILQIRFNLKKYVQVYKDMKNTEIYENLAYVDLLTGINNRNAYERDLSDLNEKIPELNSLQCAMVDINGLKAANDTYGHAAGDTLIIGVGILLKYLLDERTKLYRIGGDEFVLIFENISKDRVIHKFEELEKRRKEYNITADIKISYALGIASYIKSKHKSIKDVVEEADSMMYENKAAAKMCRA